MFDVPIAAMVFNRPHFAQALFETIRRVQPKRLFVVCDAARPDRDDEAERVAQTRAAFAHIDWPCEVTRIYADQNMGCGLRIRSGISTAFEDVERLIVLEDDCRPNETFFRFCDQLLRRYADDPRLMAVSGNCFHEEVPEDASYYFSKYAHCWGWATWRRAWQLYDDTICDWPNIVLSQRYSDLFETEHEMAYWTYQFDRIARGRCDTWDLQWMLTCWFNEGLTALPCRNLVENLGFSDDATHTMGDSPLANLPTFEIPEIIHPTSVFRNDHADRETDRLVFSGTWEEPGMIKRTLNRVRRKITKGQLAPRGLALKTPLHEVISTNAHETLSTPAHEAIGDLSEFVVSTRPK